MAVRFGASAASTRMRKARDDLLEGHEVVRVFDRGMLALGEPLRAMRIVPFLLDRRGFPEPSFVRMTPDALGLHWVGPRHATRPRVAVRHPSLSDARRGRDRRRRRLVRAAAPGAAASSCPPADSYVEAFPTLDERGEPPPRAMTVFWRMLAASGEISEPWPEARFLDRRFIDSFEQWVPPR